MSKKPAKGLSIVVDNPNNLPLITLDDLQDFQGDLKTSDPVVLRKLAESIVEHGLFIAKAIFYEDGVPYTEDGHQTLKALRVLESNGYEECDVFSYAMVDGRRQRASSEHYDYLVVPCQEIVPVGDTKEERLKDAAAKLMQINSRYAEMNPDTSFFSDLGFTADDMDQLLSRTQVPELWKENDNTPIGSKLSDFEKEFSSIGDEQAVYPIVKRYDEKHKAIIIVVDSEVELVTLQELLGLDRQRSYKNNEVGQTYVTTAAEVLKKWQSR